MNETPVDRRNIDTRFRSGLRRMAEAGRICTLADSISADLETAAMMKQRDGGPALFFEAVRSFDVPVIGNLLCCQANYEAAFGLDYGALRELIGQALSNPQPPKRVSSGPAQDHVITSNIDIGRLLPVLRHTPSDSGRFITAGIVITRDPETKVYNASYHRLQLVGPNRTAIKLDLGRHLRLAVERAQKRGEVLPVVVCIGTDLSLHQAAATMGSQMPELADELAIAGGFCGRPLPVLAAVTQDLVVPAETEIVLEGVIRPDETVTEGPFVEFIGALASPDAAPTVEITAITHRDKPIYHAINGYGRETVMLRKYVLEASLLKVLKSACPLVEDVDMSAGGLHRFHAVISIRKSSPQHEGFQRNVIAAAFGALKDLDLAIVVDDDIDIRDPHDVEYALATRMEASRDLMVLPGTRSHEMVRISDRGVRAKLGIDATVPVGRREEFSRCRFADVKIDDSRWSGEAKSLLSRLGA